MTAVDVPLLWVDAFADGPFTGNPAGVCLLDGPTDERWMQRLAFELGLSETAFVWPDGDVLSLRWFTPTTEVALCGHATLAAAHALRETGRWRRRLPAGDGDAVVFATCSGHLAARFDGGMIELDLPADRPTPCPVPPPAEGWDPVAAFRGALLAAEGSTDLVIELASAGAVRALVPDLAALAQLPYRTVVVTAPAEEPGQEPGQEAHADYVHRVFGPAVGVDEDPVTGSAQCLLGPHWAARLGRTTLVADQVSARRGRLRVTVDGARVRVAGHAVTVLAGHLAPGAAPPGAGAVTAQAAAAGHAAPGGGAGPTIRPSRS